MGGKGSQPYRIPLAGRPRASAALAVTALAFTLLVASCQGRGQEQVARAPVPVKVAPATRGNIASTLSYTGEVQAVDQIDFLASVGGRIQDVFVEEGAQVAAGTVLAQLETDTLEAQVRQAEANVQSAQARLDSLLQGARPEELAASRAAMEVLRNRYQGMLNGSRPEEIAAATAGRAGAQAGVETARANLATAEARLKQLLNPTEEDRLAAQAAFESAASGVDSARQKLEQLRNPTRSDIDAAAAAVDSARAAQQSAQARLDDLKASPKAADVAAARSSLATAEATFRSAQSTLATLKRPLNKETLRNLIDAYAGVRLAREKLASDRAIGASPETIAQDEDALNIAYRKLQLAEEEANTFQAGVSTEQLLAAQSAADAAQSSVASAQARLDLLLAGPTVTDLQAAQSAVDIARSNLVSSQIRLDRLRSPTAADMATAEAAVAAAESLQVAAQNRLTTLKNPTLPDLRSAEAAVETARGALQTALAGAAGAESALVKARTPFTETDLAAQQAQVEQAVQQLALLQTKYTRADIAAASAAVAQVEAALELSKIQLSRATLVAPFDAVVAKKSLSRGARVSAQSPVFSLVSREVRVVFNVEEGSIGRIRAGLPVAITTSAFGERAFQGQITSVAPSADAASRSFRVKVTPGQGAEGMRAGMSANVSVVIEQRERVVLVPREALVQQGAKTYVFVVQDDQADRREVELGLSNDRFAQIRSGLDEGAQVVVQGNRALRPQDRVNVIS
ncbi:MAG: efflux RND transporter periplasmic adaptor subunit [Chloroflexi bacterium]|nr:efflux RND transporter periplasmic adaptor subunit [Chloroflexota bacterium]